MALCLERLRSINWSRLWRLVANKNLVTHHKIHLADQDVINAVIADNPEVVYRLPCHYNIQVSDRKLSEMCYSQLRVGEVYC